MISKRGTQGCLSEIVLPALWYRKGRPNTSATWKSAFDFMISAHPLKKVNGASRSTIFGATESYESCTYVYTRNGPVRLRLGCTVYLQSEARLFSTQDSKLSIIDSLVASSIPRAVYQKFPRTYLVHGFTGHHAVRSKLQADQTRGALQHSVGISTTPTEDDMRHNERRPIHI